MTIAVDLGRKATKQQQEHNAVTTVKRGLATPQSRLKQSATEPLHPSNIHCYLNHVNNFIQYIKWSSVFFL